MVSFLQCRNRFNSSTTLRFPSNECHPPSIPRFWSSSRRPSSIITPPPAAAADAAAAGSLSRFSLKGVGGELLRFCFAAAACRSSYLGRVVRAVLKSEVQSSSLLAIVPPANNY
jgi:hypothetical protein